MNQSEENEGEEEVLADEEENEIFEEESDSELQENDVDEEEQLSEEELLSEETVTEEDEELLEAEEDLEEVSLRELTEEELKAKKELAASLGAFDELIPGRDYVDKTVYSITEEEEEAEYIAQIYGIELSSCELSVATYILPEDISVSEIIHIAADLSNNYPAVFPDYIPEPCYDEERSGWQSSSPSSEDENDIQISATANEVSKVGSAVAEDIAPAGQIEPFLRERSGGYYQWHHDVIGSPYAWAAKDSSGHSIDGTGVGIAIISYGTYAESNTYLKEALVDDGLSAYNTDKYGGHYNACIPSSATEACFYDDYGHGLEMASLIGANMNQKLGVGVAPGAKLYNINIGTDTPSITEWLKALAKVEQLADVPGREVNIVVIDAMYNYPLESITSQLQSKLFGIYNEGVAVFAPMKDGGAGQSYVWPASCEHVISVGATGLNNTRAAGSGYNADLDIAAPGENLSCISPNGYLENPIRGTSTAGAAAIAAAEAALIYQDRDSIKALHYNNDLNNSLITGGAFVDALESHMKASTISAGAGTGKGIVYLPKALGLGTITTAPYAPEIIEERPIYVVEEPVGSGNYVLKFDFSLSNKSYDVEKYYYTLNGKTPGFKDGVPDKNTSVYYSGSPITVNVDSSQKQFVIKAVAVNRQGVASPVSTYTVPLNIVKDLHAFAPDGTSRANLTEGKNLTLTAKILPNNAATKAVTWHIAYGGIGDPNPYDPSFELNAKSNGVTISSSGQVSAKKGCARGEYYAWAVAKKGGMHSYEDIIINVKSSTVPVITKLKPVKSSIKMYRTSFGEYYKIFDNLSVTGSTYEENTDLRCVSSNSDVVKIHEKRVLDGQKHWAAEPMGPGKATITCYTTDGSSLKTSYTVEVIQKATDIKIENGGEILLSAGKSLTPKYELYSASHTPTPTKITKWYITDAGGHQITDGSVTISNKGVVKAKKDVNGVYYVSAEITYPDGATVRTKDDSRCKIRVCPNSVSKLKADTVNSTKSVFSRTTTFLPSDECKKGYVYFEITGDLSDLGKGYEVTSSNEKILVPDTLYFNSYYGKYCVPFHATGKGTGTVTITVRALAGNSAKCSFKVTVKNPASSVKIAPAKTGARMAVAPGKTINLKATVGEEYGKLDSNGKKVTWEIPGSCPFATINAKTGALSVKKNAMYYIDLTKNKTSILVKATTESGAYSEAYVDVYRDFGKIQMCGPDGGKPDTASYTMPNNTDPSYPDGYCSMTSVYVKFPKDITGNHFNPVEGDMIYNSSNPSIAQVQDCINWSAVPGHPGGCYYNDDEFCVYQFHVNCTMPANSNKAGSTKITISTPDGAQSASFTIKVTKR